MAEVQQAHRDQSILRNKPSNPMSQQKLPKAMNETYRKKEELPNLPEPKYEHEKLEEQLKEYAGKHQRSNSGNSIMGDINFLTKAYTAAQQNASNALDQMERLRAGLREKDMETVRFKHENMLLKQIERRHQKEIEQFEAQALDAPRVIRGLREELSHVKSKVKIYFAQIGEDSRQIRQIDEERRRLREYNQRLEKLVSTKNLADRDTLNTQLQEATSKIAGLEKAVGEANRKAEYSEKNLTADNKQLRGKIHTLERENALIHERIKKMEDGIREKDKVIASLSIYRYNAINRRMEGPCKVCAKREREEHELKRRTEILEKLPPVATPVLKVTSGSTLTALLTIPPKKVDVVEFVYDKLVLQYSNDPSFMTGVQSQPIDLSEDKLGQVVSIPVTGLQSGHYYYFQATASQSDVDGPSSNVETALIDELPPSVVKPEVSFETTPIPQVRITIVPPTVSKCSDIKRYRVYTSSNINMVEKSLVTDVSIDDVEKGKDGSLIAVYTYPPICVPMYFSVASVNMMGESVLSEVSDEVTLDYPPIKPTKPTIKRLSATAIQVNSSSEVHAGSSVSSFLLVQHRVDKSIKSNPDDETAQLSDKKEMVVMPFKINALQQTIEGLAPGTCYRFQVQASNGSGDSEWSDLGDVVDVDVLVPVAPQVSAMVITDDSFEVKLPSTADIKKPKIIGYKVQWSTHPDMHYSAGTSSVLPTAQSFFTVEDLIKGETYYVAVCLVGEHEEGIYSEPLQVLLSAAFPLPPSPLPEPREEPETFPLSKTTSKGSNLSLHQRMTNMQHGMPAHHDPPSEPASGRTSLLNIKHSLDSLRGEEEGRSSKNELVPPVSLSRPAGNSIGKRVGKSGTVMIKNNRSNSNLSSNVSNSQELPKSKSVTGSNKDLAANVISPAAPRKIKPKVF